MKSLFSLALVVSLNSLFSSTTRAEEPNDTFADRTILGSGVLSVSDDLYPGDASFPDTLLGAFGSFGDLIEVDDDDSLFGDGLASGFSGVPVNVNNGIDFSVTGFGDDFFDGEHDEFGEYEAIVDVYNFSGGLEDSFSVFGTLEPGVVDNFTFSDSAWLAGSYDVNIDNTIGLPVGGDVDYFTFTGLSPGATFSAETLSGGSIDTMLFWLDDSGNELDFNDDIEQFNLLSQIEGSVPSSGQLNFAVTGFGDDFLEGSHIEEEFYDLQLTIDGASVPGDFDNDGDVDGFDLSNPNVGWQARYGNDLDGQDFLVWQQEVSPSSLAAATVPEPTSMTLFVLATLFLTNNAATRERGITAETTIHPVEDG